MTMHTPTRRRFVGQMIFGSGALAALSPHSVRAQSSALTILVGYPAGGGSDILARTLAEVIAPMLGRTVIVDNKAGAGGRIAATMLKSATADGSMVMIAPNGLTSIQTLVYKDQIKYDFAKDFAPVAKLAATDLALAVSADLKIADAAALSAWVKANPAKASFGSPAAGGLPHFAGLLLGRALGVELNHIPYKGGAPTALAVAAGEVPMGVSAIDDFVKLEQAGKLKIVGSMGAARSPVSPQVPTLVEQGIKLQAAGWSAMWAPAGTSADKLQEISAAVQKALQMDSVKQKLATSYSTPDYLPPAELSKLQQAEWEQWAPVVKASGFKPE